MTQKHKQNTIPKAHHNTGTKIFNTNLRLKSLINLHKYVLDCMVPSYCVLPQQDFLLCGATAGFLIVWCHRRISYCVVPQQDFLLCGATVGFLIVWCHRRISYCVVS
jgi:hypothetical protein